MVTNTKPRRLLTLAAAVALPAGPAAACIMPAFFSPEIAIGADALVVGRIENYRIIVNQKGRDEDLRFFFKHGRWNRLRDYFAPPGRHTGDYGRFDIAVDETLSGNVGRRLSVTWSDPPPARPFTGKHLIALRQASDGRWSKPPEPNLLTVLYPMCGEPYVFAAGSEEAKAIRATLRNPPPKPPQPAPPPDNGGRRPEWAGPFSAAQIAQFYPAKARRDEVEGSATVTCIALKSGGVTDCTIVSETPRGYGMGDAVGLLFHTHGKLKAGTYQPGDTVRTTWRWRLD